MAITRFALNAMFAAVPFCDSVYRILTGGGELSTDFHGMIATKAT